MNLNRLTLIIIFLIITLITARSDENWNAKGLELYKQGKYKEAIACFDKVLKSEPGAYKVWNNKGNALYKLMEYEKALTCYEKAMSIEPDYENAWYGKGCSLTQMKRYKEALECFERVLELLPGDKDGEARREEVIKALSLVDTKKVEEFFNRGNALYVQENYKEAYEYYNKALEIDPDYIDALYNKGCVLNQLKEYEEALRCFNKVIKLNPTYSNATNKKEMLLKTLESSFSLEMVRIKGTTLENDKKFITIRSFYMSKYEITNKEFCRYNVQKVNALDNMPVVNITWQEAAHYCNWLSKKEGLSPCYGENNETGEITFLGLERNGYRLPTEMEWEYACRGGTATDYYWGNNIDDRYLWYYENSNLTFHSVGEKLPNNLGLYDMSGNVWEWCNDRHPSGKSFVIRGGSFLENAESCRSDYRGSLSIQQAIDIGFRVVRNVP
ncbi:MAG TPA: SUMF1/EgtB/PvdO family nonheme iron enzyme [Candidatus Eremiobacteraeota bacterium]|nr:MAG: TPR repeat-containing protein YrrB [bacterium ADurb.Bin363]HPZ08099.1 SUMF1/EgtB/PvdO family nonheme iron enzyme [Candidatus Eremiobacteraeota bacterium]